MNWCLRALDSADLRGDRLLGRGRGVEPIRRAPAQTTWRGRPRLALASSICQRLRRQRDRARHAVSASVTATPALSRSVRTLLMTSSSPGASADSTSPSGSIQIPKSGRMLRKAPAMNSTPATSRTHRSAGRRSLRITVCTRPGHRSIIRPSSRSRPCGAVLLGAAAALAVSAQCNRWPKIRKG